MDSGTNELYTLSLHDALPILLSQTAKGGMELDLELLAIHQKVPARLVGGTGETDRVPGRCQLSGDGLLGYVPLKLADAPEHRPITAIENLLCQLGEAQANTDIGDPGKISCGNDGRINSGNGVEHITGSQRGHGGGSLLLTALFGFARQAGAKGRRLIGMLSDRLGHGIEHVVRRDSRGTSRQPGEPLPLLVIWPQLLGTDALSVRQASCLREAALGALDTRGTT